jgi:hypothetical protein
MTKIEEEALKWFPKDLQPWGKGQYDDLNELNRTIYTDGAKFVIDCLEDKLRELHNQYELDNQEQEKITLKCHLLMKIIKDLNEREIENE